MAAKMVETDERSNDALSGCSPAVATGEGCGTGPSDRSSGNVPALAGKGGFGTGGMRGKSVLLALAAVLLCALAVFVGGRFTNSYLTVGSDTHVNAFVPGYYTQITINPTVRVEDTSGQNKAPEGFVLELCDGEGEIIMPSDETEADGKTRLVLSYGESHLGNTFVYQLRERHGGERIKGLLYDNRVYHIAVVVRNGEGGLIEARVFLLDESSIQEITGQSSGSNDRLVPIGLDGVLAPEDLPTGAIAGLSHPIEVPADATDTLEVQYTNVYDPEDAVVRLSGRVDLLGRNENVGEFQLLLYEADENFNPVGDPVATASNFDTEGHFDFGNMTYSRVGANRYVIVQVAGGEDGIAYDSAQFQVRVDVTDVDGELRGAISYMRNGDSVDGVVFENTVIGVTPVRPSSSSSANAPDGGTTAPDDKQSPGSGSANAPGGEGNVTKSAAGGFNPLTGDAVGILLLVLVIVAVVSAIVAVVLRNARRRKRQQSIDQEGSAAVEPSVQGDREPEDAVGSDAEPEVALEPDGAVGSEVALGVEIAPDAEPAPGQMPPADAEPQPLVTLGAEQRLPANSTPRLASEPSIVDGEMLMSAEDQGVATDNPSADAGYSDAGAGQLPVGVSNPEDASHPDIGAGQPDIDASRPDADAGNPDAGARGILRAPLVLVAGASAAAVAVLLAVRRRVGRR